MRQSESMRAASRLPLSHPIVCLFAALAAVVVLGVLGPLNVVHAVDTAVEGESFNRPASGTNVITGAGYSGGAALKFTANVTASQTVNCGSPCDVVLMASGGQLGGQATFSVNGSAPQALTSTTTRAYTFHLPDGTSTISVTAGGTGTGHNAILDVVTFPASGGGTDTTAPETTITSPPSGSVIGTTVTFGFASSEPNSTFQCRLVGLDSTRTNCTSPKTYTNLTVGTQYTFKVWAKDAAGNIDSTPATRTFTPSDGTTQPAACANGVDDDGDGLIDLKDPGCSSSSDNDETNTTTGSARLVGAGDIGTLGSADTATANLIAARPDARVFTAGDNAYPNGAASDYTSKYDPDWGAFKDRTSPTPGNHEYNTSGASGYFGYFTAAASPTEPTCTSNCNGYYAYTLGAWRVYALNSNLSMASGSAQYNFVQNDLANNGALCELAYWHHPIASSGEHGNGARARPIFALFDAQGGDLVLNGHDHNYERFGKIDSFGRVSSSGVRQIVVGTGGTNLRGQTFVQPGSEVRNFDTHGIVDINLSSTGYSGKFVPVSGKTFTDSFSGTCGTT